MSKLGRCHYFGEGVDKDPKEAVKWWSMGAEKGDAYSQYNLGVCNMKGIGVDAVSFLSFLSSFLSLFSFLSDLNPLPLISGTPRYSGFVVSNGGGARLRGRAGEHRGLLL